MLLIQGFYRSLENMLNISSKLDWSHKTRLSLQLLRSNSESRINNMDLNLEKTSRIENSPGDYSKQMQEFIDDADDEERLFKLAIKYNENVHRYNNFSSDTNKRLEYLKFCRYIFHRVNFRFLQTTRSDIAAGAYPYQFFMDNLISVMQANHCNVQQSLQQMLGNFLGHFALLEFQKSLTFLFANEIHDVIIGKHEDWSSEVELSQEKMKYLLYTMYEKTASLMSFASREIWRCDPKNHIEDTTFIKLKDTFKKYSFKEELHNCDFSHQPICHGFSGNSDRYFSLQPVLSNVYNNSVITGVRLVKQNHIMYIQIQQGELLPYGMINESLVAWVPIREYEECNCYVLRWNGSRSIDLNDILVQENPYSALTGISFDKVKRNDKEHLRLVAYSTPFNFATGTLNTIDENPWRKKYPKDPSAVYNIPNAEAPIFVEKENIPDSRGDETLELSTFTLRADGGFSIPYFDIQPVESVPPSPLGGVGLYHKGNNATSGFLGLKIFTCSIAAFINL